MYKLQTLNKISANGLDRLPRDSYETASEILNPDGVLVRSANMLEMETPASVKAIARAGAGYNNIPVEKCTDRGVVVFNTPGANANAVKELVLLGMLISSRRVFDGMVWAKGLVGKGEDVPKIIEKDKGNFVGPEIKGKKLGVVGLGAIGVMVANDAVALGMEVLGYDPFISVEAAWGLSRGVKRAVSLDTIFAECDYITLHVPQNDKTKGMICNEKIALMKKEVRILNFARGGLVVNADIMKALDEGRVAAYITDFPDEELLKNDKVLSIPHLGASSPESEENCAVMAVDQMRDFLEDGNIKNSVNFPECVMPRSPGRSRLLVANRNMPNMIGQITAILAAEKINISEMLNKHRDQLAYNIIDTDSEIADDLVGKIKAIDGVIMARVI